MGVGWGDPLKKNFAQIRKKVKNLIVVVSSQIVPTKLG